MSDLAKYFAKPWRAQTMHNGSVIVASGNEFICECGHGEDSRDLANLIVSQSQLASLDPDDDTILDVAEAAYDAALDINVPTRTLLHAALTAVKAHLAKGEG